MAGFTAIAAVGKSIERLLANAFLDRAPVPGKTTKAALIRAEDITDAQIKVSIGDYGLSILLYRVDFNKTMRAAWSAVGYHDGVAHLPLDLHFLLTAWAGNAEHEHALLGRALQILETLPILSGPLLQPAGGWAAGDAVQVSMEEISTEAVMRTFDSLPVDYRLSVPYIVRVIRLDGREAAVRPTVTTAVTGTVPQTTTARTAP